MGSTAQRHTAQTQGVVSILYLYLFWCVFMPVPLLKDTSTWYVKKVNIINDCMRGCLLVKIMPTDWLE